MRASFLAAVLFAGCGPSARPAAGADDPVAKAPVPDAVTSGAPCFPDRESIRAAELFEATHAGSPGNCRIEWEMPDIGTGYTPESDPVVYDGDRRVAKVFRCAIDVLVPGVVDEHGIGIGDDAKAVPAAYPLGELRYELRSELMIMRKAGDANDTTDDPTVAYFALDGDTPVADDEAAIAALAGHHITAMTIMLDCE